MRQVIGLLIMAAAVGVIAAGMYITFVGDPDDDEGSGDE